MPDYITSGHHVALLKGHSLRRGVSHQFHLSASGVTSESDISGNRDLHFWRTADKAALMLTASNEHNNCEVVHEVVVRATAKNAPILGRGLDLATMLSDRLRNVTVEVGCATRKKEIPSAENVRDLSADLLGATSSTLKIMMEDGETAPAAYEVIKALGKVMGRGKVEDDGQGRVRPFPEKGQDDDKAARWSLKFLRRRLRHLLARPGLPEKSGCATEQLLRCVRDAAWSPEAPDAWCRRRLGRDLLHRWARLLELIGGAADDDDFGLVPKGRKRWRRFTGSVDVVARKMLRKLAFVK